MCEVQWLQFAAKFERKGACDCCDVSFFSFFLLPSSVHYYQNRDKMIPLSLVIFVFLHSMKRDTSHRVIASHHHRHFQFNQAMISLSWEYLILLSYHHDMIKLWSSEKMQKSPETKIIHMRSQDNSFPSGNSWSHLENYSVAHKFFHIIIWQRWLRWLFNAEDAVFNKFTE